MFTRAFPADAGHAARGNPAVIADPITWTARTWSITTCGDERDLRHDPAAARPRDSVAAHGPAGARRLHRVGAGRVVARRGSRDGAEPAPRARSTGPRAQSSFTPSSPCCCGPPPGTGRRRSWPGGPSAHRSPRVCSGSCCGGASAYLALQPAARAPQALSHSVSAHGLRPARLAGRRRQRPRHAAQPPGPCRVDHPGRRPGQIALGIYLPLPAVRAVLILAVAVAALVWVAQGLGGLFSGSGTDPDSGLAARPARRRVLACPPAHSSREPSARHSPSAPGSAVPGARRDWPLLAHRRHRGRDDRDRGVLRQPHDRRVAVAAADRSTTSTACTC